MKSRRYSICGDALRRRGDSVEKFNGIKAVYAAEKFAETPHNPDRGVVWGCVTATPLQTANLRAAFFLNAKRAFARGIAESLDDFLGGKSLVNPLPPHAKSWR